MIGAMACRIIISLMRVSSYILLVDANIIDAMVCREHCGHCGLTWPRSADSRVEDEVERHRPKQRRFGRVLRNIQDYLSKYARE